MPPRWRSHRGIFPNLFDTYWVCPFLKRDNVNLLDRPRALPRACKRLTAVVKNDWDLKLFTFSKLSLDIPTFSCSSVGVLWSKPTVRLSRSQFSLYISHWTGDFTAQRSWPSSISIVSRNTFRLPYESEPKFSQWMFEHCSRDDRAFVLRIKKRISKAHTFPAVFLEQGAWTAIPCPTCCAPGQQIHTSSSVFLHWKSENIQILLWPRTQRQGGIVSTAVLDMLWMKTT